MLLPLAVAIASIAALRFAYAGAFELAPDEAYYARWASAPALTYPDHPPAVAWIIAATTGLIGWTERGVRAAAILCSALCALAAYALAREADLPRRDALGAPLLASVALLPAVGALIATPDAPLLCAWSAGATLLLRACRTRAPAAWIGFGLCAGLALWCKHSGVLLLAVAWAAPAPRRQLRWLLAATAISLAIAAPYGWAESREGLVSLRFQLRHAFGPEGIPPWSGPGEVLGAHLLLLTPVLAWEALRFLRRPGADPTRGTLYALAAVPLGAVLLSSVLRHPEANWAAPAYPALVTGALVAWSRRAEASRRFVGRLGLAVALVMAFAVHLHVVRPFLPLPPMDDPTSRLHGWRDLVSSLRGRRPQAAADYGVAAELWFYAPGRPDVTIAVPDESWVRRSARRADGEVVRDVALKLAPDRTN